ncbi:MAG TPA: DUF3817 domain-containing protein [Fimbriimonas sp.]|nr:DUF3817 domain-containing protein [Fimbriimonas sp.]
MTALQIFRKTSLVEGCSAILLFLVAMPLKYLANMPMAVKIVGTAHGALFVALVLALLNVWRADKWPIGKVFVAFVAANIPFGAFWFESKLKKEENDV